MAKGNKKFLMYGIILTVLGIILMFFYSGLQSDHVTIIQTFITKENGGWSSTQTLLPRTVGDFLCIILTFIYGTLFIKFGVKRPLSIVMIVTAVGAVLIAAANGLDVNGGAESGNYALYFAGVFIVRIGCLIFQMAGFMLVANWFIRFRGQIMGIVTIGSPLFSVIGTSGMTNLIHNKFGGDYRPFYIGIAVILVIIAIVVLLVVKDTPEDAGLYPDGADRPPASEAGEAEIKLTVGEVLREKKSWQLIISFGAFQFIIAACMGVMAVYYMSLGGIDVWLAATKYLAIGAALGIPMSYVFGFLDDKLGSVIASIVLGCCELIPVLALLLQPQGGNTGLMLLWGFGVACMTGGVPTLHPCITAYCFGRRKYQSANRIIMAIQLIPYSFAAMMMTLLVNAGKGKMAFVICVVIVVIGIVATATLLGTEDANAAERSRKKPKEAS